MSFLISWSARGKRGHLCTRHVVPLSRFECLEHRIALSIAPTPVVASDGSLQIVGTNARDVIEIRQSDSNLRVTLKSGNESARYFFFDAADVSSIFVNGLEGSNIIEIDDALVIPATVIVGKSNDFVRTGGGNDTVHGSLGSDDIRTGAGNDTVYAGGGSDQVRTDEGDDIVFGEGGDDRIWTNGGDDWVDAGTGNDKIWTDSGDDTVYGDRGQDMIIAGGGNDFVDAGDHDDTIDTGNGDDVIIAGSGRDVIHAGSGNDTVDCGSGPDLAYGDTGNDTIHGGEDGDEIYGGGGNDVITDVQGDNFIFGGPGNDIVTVHANETNYVDLGSGIDELRTSTAAIFAGPVLDRVTRHFYYVLQRGSWTAAESAAISIGGHLAAINSAAENVFVYNSFAPLVSGNLWIGLSDVASEGTFVWTNGEPLTYVNWAPFEPNNLGEEDFGMIFGTAHAYASQWNDGSDLHVGGIGEFGVVEISA